MIELEQISIRYGERFILKDFSGQIVNRQMTLLYGKSGCGKSSLLKALMGFVRISSGRIIFEGEEMTSENVFRIRQKTSYLPQELSMPVEWVSEMIQMLLDLKSHKQTFSKNRFVNYCKALALDPNIYNQKLDQLSGGERQRLMLLTVAMLDKPYLLLDEPTSALDTERVRLVYDFFRLLQEEGKTIIAVSHDNFLLEHCDQIINL